MKFIELTNSKRLAAVDDKDIERIILLDTRWYVQFDKDGKPGAIRSTKHFKNRRSIYLHRFVMGCIDDNGMDVDHINLDIFDNRRYNLRWATFSQNKANGKVPKNSTTGEKNIHFPIESKKFEIRFRKNKKIIYGGSFNTLAEAIIVRNRMSKELWGEFSNY